MYMQVHIVCQNLNEDRVIPRMARYLRDRLGWAAGTTAESCDVLYLSGYFEAQRMKPWPDVPMAAYFTHREEEPAGNAKAKLYDAVAGKVDLRIATARMYAEGLDAYGRTAQVSPPLERERFVITTKAQRHKGERPVVGLSGYTYSNKRKGEDLVKGLLGSRIGGLVDWRASGRGWPVPTKRYTWEQMPGFYQGLGVLVVTSRVEGVPMPPLEALACGVRVVVPRGVGLLDELPETPGIHRYERGDLKSLLIALEEAAFPSEGVEPEALRAATEAYSVEAWCEDHAQAFEAAFGGETQRHEATEIVVQMEEVDAGIDAECEAGGRPADDRIHTISPTPKTEGMAAPEERGTGSERGIYCVAFGGPARESCARMMESAKKHMPDVPIALCAAKRIGPEDVFIPHEDSDVGGRRAKLKAYELSPAEWKATLYLDADTVVTAPIYRYFEWIEDGWEFVICKDPHLMDTMTSFARRNNGEELEEVRKTVRTLNTLQWNGGVWAFGRSERIAAFFSRWQEEWEVHAQRDQGALVRAMYADPLRIWLLGNEWNTFPKYMPTDKTAGLLHFPGDARRWKGLIPGRIDGKEAWKMAETFERQRKGRG